MITHVKHFERSEERQLWLNLHDVIVEGFQDLQILRFKPRRLLIGRLSLSRGRGRQRGLFRDALERRGREAEVDLKERGGDAGKRSGDNVERACNDTLHY